MRFLVRADLDRMAHFGRIGGVRDRGAVRHDRAELAARRGDRARVVQLPAGDGAERDAERHPAGDARAAAASADAARARRRAQSGTRLVEHRIVGAAQLLAEPAVGRDALGVLGTRREPGLDGARRSSLSLPSA